MIHIRLRSPGNSLKKNRGGIFLLVGGVGTISTNVEEVYIVVDGGHYSGSIVTREG